MMEYKFNKKFIKSDDENIFVDVSNAVCSLPGVFGLNAFHIDNGIANIMFKLDGNNPKSQKSLFFIGRCIDRRYWEFGWDWQLKIEIADLSRNESGEEVTPLLYNIASLSNKSEEDIQKELKSLLESMNYHLNHKNFMKGFNIDVNDFDLLPNKILITEKSEAQS